MEEAERIAAGLSEAHRRAIIGARDMMSSHGGYPFYVIDYAGPWDAPVAEFLTLTTDRLSPLGIQVRAILLQDKG